MHTHGTEQECKGCKLPDTRWDPGTPLLPPCTGPFTTRAVLRNAPETHMMNTQSDMVMVWKMASHADRMLSKLRAPPAPTCGNVESADA